MPFGLDTKSLILGVIVGAVVIPFAQAKLASAKG